MGEIISQAGEKSNLPLSDKSRSLMELASGMRSWMTWAPADLSLEETARHQYKGRRRALQMRSCRREGHSSPTADRAWTFPHREQVPSTVAMGPLGWPDGTHGCWPLTSQLLRSRCRSLI